MLGAEYVEYIHDELVARLWPGADPIAPGEYRNRQLIESATGRPFQSAFGQDAYQTVTEKAAALFHSLISNHPFHDGNKRTAVMAFDMFLIANGWFVLLGNPAVYKLAEQTASCNQRNLSPEQCLRDILDAVEESVVPLWAIQKVGKKDSKVASLYSGIKKSRGNIRRSKLNIKIPT